MQRLGQGEHAGLEASSRVRRTRGGSARRAHLGVDRGVEKARVKPNHRCRSMRGVAAGAAFRGALQTYAGRGTSVPGCGTHSAGMLSTKRNTPLA